MSKKYNAREYMSGATENRVMDLDETCGFTEDDAALLERLQSFIPDKVFDAHCHLFRLSDMPKAVDLFAAYGTVDMERCLKDQKFLYGDKRKFRGLILPTPSKLFSDDVALRDEMNAWMNEELKKAPDCVGAIYVMPTDTKEKIESMITNPQIRGFKCYHQTAKCDGPTFLADVEEYLPESAWEVANERGMSITIHMVKPNALADEKNMAYYKKMTAKYPNAKLILAHCARGFGSWTTIETIRELKGIPNVYCDMAAITDVATIAETIRQLGPDHVMWASDYHIDRAHGKAVNCGETFRWLYCHELPKETNFPCCMTVLEALFAFYQATLLLDMSKDDIEQVFYRTGCNLYGLEY